MTVGVVIPAHNEESGIGAVLAAAIGAPTTGQVVVVSDDSSDGTAQVAREAGAQVIEITAGDKGTAMATGLFHVELPWVLFLDADLVGLTAAHVHALSIIAPLDGMVVGMREGTVPTGLPPISGERRLPTDFAKSIPLVGTGYRAELLIDAAVARAGLPHRHYAMAGVTNPTRNLRHPLMWADLAVTAAINAPALARYVAQDVKTS